MQDVEQAYKTKKNEYEQVVASVESENASLEAEHKKLKVSIKT